MPKHIPIYLDYAAATPLDAHVLACMLPYLQANFYNPSAAYDAALEVHRALEKARAKVAHWLGVQASEIIFTAGGTEANNVSIQGVMRQYPTGNIVLSAIEHESIIAPAAHYNFRIVPVKPDGLVDLDILRRSIDKQTVLVSVMYANNEIGTVQPLHEVSRIIQEHKTERNHQRAALAKKPAQSLPYPLYFHSDACQAPNYLDMHVARLGVDLLTLNGGKMYGPKQSGALYIRRGISLAPIIEGGGQEHGLRSGTENVAGAIGFAASLDQTQTMRRAEAERLRVLQHEFYAQLETTIPRAILNGSKKFRLPNNIHLTIPEQDNERLLIALDEAGIQAAAGSACSASSELPSHVLRALGISDQAARSSVRFTMGRPTTSDMMNRTIQVLARLTDIR